MWHQLFFICRSAHRLICTSTNLHIIFFESSNSLVFRQSFSHLCIAMVSTLSTISTPNYSIQIGDASIDQLSVFLKKNRFSKIFILVDEHSLQHCLPQLVARVKKLSEAEIIELESGEKNKTIEVCTNVWRALGELGAD